MILKGSHDWVKFQLSSSLNSNYSACLKILKLLSVIWCFLIATENVSTVWARSREKSVHTLGHLSALRGAAVLLRALAITWLFPGAGLCKTLVRFPWAGQPVQSSSKVTSVSKPGSVSEWSMVIQLLASSSALLISRYKQMQTFTNFKIWIFQNLTSNNLNLKYPCYPHTSSRLHVTFKKKDSPSFLPCCNNFLCVFSTLN